MNIYTASLIGALMLFRQECDGLICGLEGSLMNTVSYVKDIVGFEDETRKYSAMQMLVCHDSRTLFLADTMMQHNPSVDDLVNITLKAAQEVRNFKIEPKIALLSFSNYGSSHLPEAKKIAQVAKILHDKYPELEVDGEMKADLALNPNLAKSYFPNSHLKDAANLLIMPNLESANISFNLLKHASPNHFVIGPILLGAKQPVQIVTGVDSSRELYNMTLYMYNKFK